ncbi:MAG TPA: TRAP transporter large permease subunit [Smithellaceae bacterium]|nr:TRAP transporter large permease subunit [Smithellaceae bacterium]HRS88100.1 TRAP transporter large permease subunit [Smithellaceae bacterium]HRV25426.1 TRAP transporter large permease subunit [Smithellaceae bacterium]
MSLTMIALLMILAVIVFFFLGHPLAFVLGGVGTLFGLFMLGTGFFGTLMDRIFVGIMGNFTLVAITLFILMGNLLTISGIADRLFESLRYFLGSIRGGLGLAVLAVCIVLAACIGIVGASVVTVGLLTGPMLLRYGYQKELTMGIVAAGGTLGLIIPPSIMLIVMGDTAGLPVSNVLAAAIVPGLFMTILYMTYVRVRCGLNPELGPPIPAEEMAMLPFGDRLMDFIIYSLLPLALIIGVIAAIFFGFASPTQAAGIGATIAFILVIIYRRFNWQDFLATLYQTAKASTMVLIIMVGASCFTGIFLGMGGGKAIVETLTSLGLGKWGLFFIMMISLVILGCFVDWVGLIFLTFPIFLPIARLMGFDMVWFIIMMAMYLQVSFLIPPFGYALFYLAGMKIQGINWGHIYRGVLPFLIIQIIALLIFTSIPDLVLFVPMVLYG